MSDLTTRVVNRHTNIAGAVQIELVPDVRGGSAPVVAGELLVPNEVTALQELDAALRGLKLGRGGGRAVAGGTLSLVTLPSLLPGKLGGVLGTLLQQGHRVRPNAVVAAGSGPVGGVARPASSGRRTPCRPSPVRPRTRTRTTRAAHPSR